MPIRFKHRILDHLAHKQYRPSSTRSMARALRIASDDRGAFDQSIQHLLDDGSIEIGGDELIRLPVYPEEITGTFRLNARGFGFLIPDQPYRHGDVFVPRGNTRDAISGDRVRVRTIHREQRGNAREGRSPYIGRILEVIERGSEHFVGTLRKRGRDWFVDPDGRSLHDAVLIRDPHARNAKAGDKVVIELLHYPQDDYLAEGVITKVLGEAGKPKVETQAVIEAHGLRTDFPETVMTMARDATKQFEAQSNSILSDREDLRSMFTFTIDPPDARDFDDAISVVFDETSNEWTLGVHIADVAHFVKLDTAINDEALARGNSVYLPRLVLPMLPEVLSNGVCSLQEGVERYTISALITFNRTGKVLNQRFCSSIIRSRKRLTYLEAQALIDGDLNEARKHARAEPEYSDELVEAVHRAEKFAKILRKRRVKDGMIVLNLPEVELIFDDDGHVIDATPEDNAFTHTIIEMFMVEANEAAARLFDTLDTPILRRIHPEPMPGDIEELRMYARAAKMDVPDEPTRYDLQRLLSATRDTPAARAIHFAVLRTLTRASYSPALVGHYALASEQYAHFTSPIRRYPDLSLHRALKAYFDLTDNGQNVPGGRKRNVLRQNLSEDDRVPNEGVLIELGRHCSETEEEATAAERELRDFLVMQFLCEHHLGDEFDGVVTGVRSSGVFVSLNKFLTEGMIAVDDLPQPGKRAGRWVVNEMTGRLVNQNSSMSIGIGDVIIVKILRIDLASRHMDLMLSEFPQAVESTQIQVSHSKRREPVSSSRSSSPKGKRKGYKQGRRGRRGR